MKRLVFIFVAVLLGLCCVSYLLKEETISFATLLELLNNTQITFPNLYGRFAAVSQAMRVLRESLGSWAGALALTSIVIEVISIPLALLIDIVSFINSILTFITALFGYVFWG